MTLPPKNIEFVLCIVLFERGQYEIFRSWWGHQYLKNISFEFWWPKIRSMLWPNHYRATGKCWNALYFASTSESMLLAQDILILWKLLSMTHLQFWINDLSFGSFEVIWGQTRFCQWEVIAMWTRREVKALDELF